MFVYIVLLVGLGIVLRSRVRKAGLPAGFETLLDRSTTTTSAASGVAERSVVTGEFRGRKVVITLHRPSRFGRAHLVISMETKATRTVEEHELLRFRYSRDHLALDALTGFRLTHQPCCLKVLSEPVAAWVPFPGRFYPRRWQSVLEAMHRLAGALDPGG
ncbi:MAG TPA: hypothetical protein VHI98_17950 [Vicinamibacterales bacterium]|nr:hypothetical protein [Vicinamibacterales bacterium]